MSTRALSMALTWLACLLLAACAHVEPPSGGPDDEMAPQLVITRPDTMAIVPGWDAPAVFVFDERISETGIDEVVSVSPRTSTVLADHGRDELRVRLRDGWVDGTIYHVIVDPEVRDLFGNELGAPLRLVFSTGPEIPDTCLDGQVIDRVTGEPETDIRVEAIRQPDSLVYAIPTDSAGAFTFAHIPEGSYLVRAFGDLNRNRELDPFEPRDSSMAAVAVGSPANARLAVLQPDSTAPRVASAAIEQGDVVIEFDDYLDPAYVPTVVIRRPDGGPVAVVSTVVGEMEPLPEVEADTSAAAVEADIEPDIKPDAVPKPPAAPAEQADAPVADAPEPLPSRTVTVRPAAGTVLEPGEYVVTVSGARNLWGLVGGGETTLDVDPPPEEGGDNPELAETDA
jgi:hypothetical protein